MANFTLFLCGRVSVSLRVNICKGECKHVRQIVALIASFVEINITESATTLFETVLKC